MPYMSSPSVSIHQTANGSVSLELLSAKAASHVALSDVPLEDRCKLQSRVARPFRGDTQDPSLNGVAYEVDAALLYWSLTEPLRRTIFCCGRDSSMEEIKALQLGQNVVPSVQGTEGMMNPDVPSLVHYEIPQRRSDQWTRT